MRKILIAMLLLSVVVVVSCKEGSSNNTDNTGNTEDTGDIEAICKTEGETRSIHCGYNGNGTQKQTCTDGYWINNGDCDDTDVCKNDDTRSIDCGYNGNGTQKQTCTDGYWINDGNCDDPDVCENDTVRRKTNRIPEVCIEGQWQYVRETRQWGTSEWDKGKSVTVDSNDNIYVTGYTSGDLDGNTSKGGDDIFLSKWSADGTKLWTKQWGTSEWDSGHSVAVDSNDNIYVTGYASGDLDGNTHTGRKDIFLTKFSPDGTKQWTRQWGTSSFDEGFSVAVDSNDNIYVAGYTSGDLDGNINAGSYDIFLTKFSPDGTKQWTRQWGTSSFDEGFSVAVDSNDNIYVAGYTSGDLDGNTSKGGDDIFLSKWSADGTKLWTKQWGTSEWDKGHSVAVDSNNNIYVTGSTFGDFDDNTSPEGDCYSPPCNDIFLTKLSVAGTKQWIKQWGSSERDCGYSVAVDGDDNIYVTGHTIGNLEGNTNQGFDDIFLSKWSADGTRLWTWQWGTGWPEVGKSVIIDSKDNIYVTGYTRGYLDRNTNAGEWDIFLTKYFSY